MRWHEHNQCTGWLLRRTHVSLGRKGGYVSCPLARLMLFCCKFLPLDFALAAIARLTFCQLNSSMHPDYDWQLMMTSQFKILNDIYCSRGLVSGVYGGFGGCIATIHVFCQSYYSLRHAIMSAWSVLRTQVSALPSLPAAVCKNCVLRQHLHSCLTVFAAACDASGYQSRFSLSIRLSTLLGT